MTLSSAALVIRWIISLQFRRAVEDMGWQVTGSGRGRAPTLLAFQQDEIFTQLLRVSANCFASGSDVNRRVPRGWATVEATKLYPMNARPVQNATGVSF